MGAAYIILFIALSASIIFISITLSYLIDYFEKYTKLSAALLSGIIFSMINSFPELITSVLSSFDIGAEKNTIFNNLIGGNLFILGSLAFVTIIFIKNFNKNKIFVSNVINISALAICYCLIAYALFVPDQYQVKLGGTFNLMSLIVIFIYISVFIYSTFFEKRADTSNKEIVLPRWLKKINMKFALILFVSLSFGIIGISIGLTFVDEKIIDLYFNNSKVGFAASLLLGIPTSLPEVVSIVMLCKIKNYEASFQTIIGSCIFSIFSLGLCDGFSSINKNPSSIYDFDFSKYSGIGLFKAEQFTLMIFSIIMVVFFIICLGICKAKKFKRIFITIFSSLITILFFAYLIMGATYMTTNIDESSLLAFNDFYKLISMRQSHQSNTFFLQKFA